MSNYRHHLLNHLKKLQMSLLGTVGGPPSFIKIKNKRKATIKNLEWVIDQINILLDRDDDFNLIYPCGDLTVMLDELIFDAAEEKVFPKYFKTGIEKDLRIKTHWGENNKGECLVSFPDDQKVFEKELLEIIEKGFDD